MDPDKPNPFSTGGGDTPKKVVGHQDARQIISSVIASIRGPMVAPEGVVLQSTIKLAETLSGSTTSLGSGVLRNKPLGIVKLIGPRGMGKTTLLSYAHSQAEQAKVHIVHLGHLEDMSQEGSALASLIDELKAPWWHVFAKIRELQLAGFGMGFGIGLERRKDRYEKMLRSRLASEPVLFLLDDAQYYEPKVLRMVIRSTQQLLARGYRVAMILAGTPQLASHLMDLEIPSINRGNTIYVNTINEEEARQALLGPFADDGIGMSALVAEELVSLAEGYPYFIQIVGFVAWKAMAEENSNDIDTKLMEKIVPLVEEAKRWFFYSMYEQLDRADLLPTVNKIITLLYAHEEVIWKSQMIKDLAEKETMSRADIWKLIDRLLDLGVLSIDSFRNLRIGIPGVFKDSDNSYNKLQQVAKKT